MLRRKTVNILKNIPFVEMNFSKLINYSTDTFLHRKIFATVLNCVIIIFDTYVLNFNTHIIQS
jgi:hypothetical protein